MKLLLGLIIAILAAVAFTERPTFMLESMGISTVTSISTLNVGITTYKDLLIYYDVSSDTPTMAIRRRNADGVYVPVANFTESATFYASTNGKWIATLPLNDGATLFTIDENNDLSNGSFVNTRGGFVLSDDTFVGFDPVSELDDGNFTIRTYEYEASNNTWMNIPGTELVFGNTAMWSGDYSSYRVTDDHLTVAVFSSTENITINIYERNADKSWGLMDSVPVNSSFEQPPSVTYNGVDTLVCAYPMFIDENVYGIAFLYTKINGVWTETALRVLELGIRPLGLIGYTAIFLDTNTLLLSVALDGYGGGAGVTNGGKILMFTRSANGTWVPALELIGGPGLFGIGLGVNDRDVIATSLTSFSGMGYYVTFYSGPLCFADPINVTCHDQQVNDCSLVEFSDLYTVNNPQCGAVTANIKSFSLVNNQAVQTQFSFTKNFGQETTCDVTVTCPAPPMAPVSENVTSAGVIQVGFASLLFTIVLAFV